MHGVKSVLALLVLIAGASPSASNEPEKKIPIVTLEVLPLKASYRPNEPVTFKAVLANRGEVPVMIERFTAICRDDFHAFVDVEIKDSKGESARRSGCAGSVYFLPGDLERLVNEVGNKNSWIELKPGELYGQETSREVKTGKGRYTIAGYFVSTRFNEQQRKMLADKKMTVIFGLIHAAPVQISVR